MFYKILYGKTLVKEGFFVKAPTCSFLKNKLRDKCFLVNFPKFLKSVFLIEHLQAFGFFSFLDFGSSETLKRFANFVC